MPSTGEVVYAIVVVRAVSVGTPLASRPTHGGGIRDEERARPAPRRGVRRASPPPRPPAGGRRPPGRLRRGPPTGWSGRRRRPRPGGRPRPPGHGPAVGRL